MGTGGLFLRKVRAAVDDEPTGFVWVEAGMLAGTGYPASRSQIEWLTKKGIRAILTLTEQALPDDYVDGFDLRVAHIPMGDHQAPDVDSMKKGADFIVEQLKAGKPVAVHCLGGEGRTGCVLAAYLISEKHLGADEALEALRKIKPQFVEWAQEKSIFEYARVAKL